MLHMTYLQLLITDLINGNFVQMTKSLRKKSKMSRVQLPHPSHMCECDMNPKKSLVQINRRIKRKSEMSK